MIIGAHAIIYSEDADATRAFWRDTLGFSRSVDAGQGWLIFALPPAEVAMHPDASGGRHELYLLCDDIEATVDQLKAGGVEFTSPITDQGWGRLTSLKVPGAGELGLYEPRHPLAAMRGNNGGPTSTLS
jgi:catechol 2,3-dioxygenase-like lactoylglutathione lyase family enzyme